ncbi:CNNM domain-containing protein [Nesterenkonia xinjiangensis]|uniref:CBS domain containing-hemolysin-like protein n=1 Tax=Nesterenkonia xinjiangensis TaxID=225327 RepID=A0A7Z0GMJ7_9MICC|nr:CBS domain containing-hemolysin-like protein [Nesterenkonia xinjiangensis]
MSEWLLPLLGTAVIIALSAFFVVVEFSLLAARRHRLEDKAQRSASARAAVRGLDQLTVMLAAAQLGITACTFALGAITKPAVHHLLMPLLAFLPVWVADVVAFTLALLIVTFLHLVVGEMAPKSWAIADPERSATLIALPAQLLVRLLGPALRLINALANRLVKAAGVEPVDRAAAAGYDSETIRTLVEHSTEAGTLDAESGRQISDLLGLGVRSVDEIVEAHAREVPLLPAGSTAGDVQEACRQSRRLRVLIEVPSPSRLQVVHVRDTLRADPDDLVQGVARAVLVIASGTTVYDALQEMRAAGEQLAVIKAPGRIVGIITWKDILDELWPGVSRIQ